MKWFNTLAPALLITLAASATAVAAEGTWEYRHEWDLAWRIINFFILAFILVKIGKEPIRNLLESRSAEIDSEIKKAETFKAEAQQEYEGIMEEVSQADAKIREVTETILSQAEDQKNRILQEAKEMSERMIQDAESSIEFLMRKARQELHEELVDMAIQMAEEKIRKKITKKDQTNLAQKYVTDLLSESTAG